MATVAPGHVIAVEDMVPMEDAAVISIGQSIGIAPRDGPQAGSGTALARPSRALPVLAQGRAAAALALRPQSARAADHLPDGRRLGCAAGCDIARRKPGATRGSHGYDPALPSMRATFIAHGPAFRQGVVIPAFDNVDVYPLMTRLLDIPARANDGDIAPLLPALRSM